MKLVVFTASRSFERFLTESLETGFEVRSRLQSSDGEPDKLYLLHLSSMKLAGFEWMLKHVSGNPVMVAVCSDLPLIDEMLESVRLGARAYCNSHMAATHYRQMLRLLSQGQSWFPPHMLEESFKLAQQAIRDRPRQDLLQRLTSREKEIALAVSGGKSNRQVADLHAISEATVKTHLTSIFRKLDVSDRVGLVLLLKRS
jgi:DNA-binding NarL/FixJ family response regulator